MGEKLMRVIEIENESQLVKFLTEFSGGGGIGIEKDGGIYFAVAFRDGQRTKARLKPKIYEQYVRGSLFLGASTKNPSQIKSYLIK